MPTQISLDQLPAEILLEVVGWVCHNEINLNVLSVAKRIRSIALSHPTLQALGAFRIEHTKTGVCIVINTDDTPTPATTNLASHSLCPSIARPIRDLLAQPWCNEPNVRRLQLALTKTLIRREWTPFLTRDGRLDHPDALTHLLDNVTGILEQSERAEIHRHGTEWYTLADTVEGYTWTYLQIWPAPGRVVIRDRVSNSSREIDVPVVRSVEDARDLRLV